MSNDASLGMSDDDFLKQYEDAGVDTEFSLSEPEAPEDAEIPASDKEDEQAPIPTSTPDGEEEEVDGEGTDEEESHEEDTEVSDEGDDSDEEDTEEEDLVSDADTEEPDYKALHEQLLQPFKANGSEMSVQNVEEAVKLMQMGANYTKKMTALKPNLKLMKMLENNKLLDENKLNLLIDVANGNPEAISKLVQDNKIDPMDLTTEENKYTPKNHTVGDHEVELDEVISRIQDTASFADTMDIVSSKWDDTSKRDIASNPQALEVINTHVSNGTYAKVMAEVNRIQAFGGLQGLSTFDAYKQVGGQMYEAGKLGDSQATEKETKVVVKTAPKAKPTDKPRKDKRKAASPARNTSTPKPQQQDFNPLNMSDEEFEKHFN